MIECEFNDYIKIDDNGDIITPYGRWARHKPFIDLLEPTGKTHIIKTKKKQLVTDISQQKEFKGTFKEIV